MTNTTTPPTPNLGFGYLDSVAKLPEEHRTDAIDLMKNFEIDSLASKKKSVIGAKPSIVNPKPVYNDKGMFTHFDTTESDHYEYNRRLMEYNPFTKENPYTDSNPVHRWFKELQDSARSTVIRYRDKYAPKAPVADMYATGSGQHVQAQKKQMEQFMSDADPDKHYERGVYEQETADMALPQTAEHVNDIQKRYNYDAAAYAYAMLDKVQADFPDLNLARNPDLAQQILDRAAALKLQELWQKDPILAKQRVRDSDAERLMVRAGELAYERDPDNYWRKTFIPGYKNRSEDVMASSAPVGTAAKNWLAGYLTAHKTDNKEKILQTIKLENAASNALYNGIPDLVSFGYWKPYSTEHLRQEGYRFLEPWERAEFDNSFDAWGAGGRAATQMLVTFYTGGLGFINTANKGLRALNFMGNTAAQAYADSSAYYNLGRALGDTSSTRESYLIPSLFGNGVTNAFLRLGKYKNIVQDRPVVKRETRVLPGTPDSEALLPGMAGTRPVSKIPEKPIVHITEPKPGGFKAERIWDDAGGGVYPGRGTPKNPHNFETVFKINTTKPKSLPGPSGPQNLIPDAVAQNLGDDTQEVLLEELPTFRTLSMAQNDPVYAEYKSHVDSLTALQDTSPFIPEGTAAADCDFIIRSKAAEKMFFKNLSTVMPNGASATDAQTAMYNVTKRMADSGVWAGTVVLNGMAMADGTVVRLSYDQAVDCVTQMAKQSYLRSVASKEGNGSIIRSGISALSRPRDAQIGYAFDNDPQIRDAVLSVGAMYIRDFADGKTPTAATQGNNMLDSINGKLEDADIDRMRKLSGMDDYSVDQWKNVFKGMGGSSNTGGEIAFRFAKRAIDVYGDDPNKAWTIYKAAISGQQDGTGVFNTRYATALQDEMTQHLSNLDGARKWLAKMDEENFRDAAWMLAAPSGQDMLKDAPEAVRETLGGTLKKAVMQRIDEMGEKDFWGTLPFRTALYFRSKGLDGLAGFAKDPITFYGGLIAILGLGGIALSSLFDGGDDDDDEEAENERSSSGIDYSQFVEAMNNGW